VGSAVGAVLSGKTRKASYDAALEDQIMSFRDQEFPSFNVGLMPRKVALLVCTILMASLFSFGTDTRSTTQQAASSSQSNTTRPIENEATKHPYWTLFKLIAEGFKQLIEGIAFACAAGFFIYKAFSGYLISNLTLAVECDRRRSKDDDSDYLSVTALIKKGERGAVTLHDAEATLLVTSTKDKFPKKLEGIQRLSSEESKTGIFKLLSQNATKTPLLNLPPGEETQFSTFFRIPAQEPCIVVVTILGGWAWHAKTRYQWRASRVSLPLDGKAPQLILGE